MQETQNDEEDQALTGSQVSLPETHVCEKPQGLATMTKLDDPVAIHAKHCSDNTFCLQLQLLRVCVDCTMLSWKLPMSATSAVVFV